MSEYFYTIPKKINFNIFKYNEKNQKYCKQSSTVIFINP
ncbi:hypothetical protein NO004_270014 [Flavobacterium psychrophilum]|nr:hypothetical protein NO004_270014 [Flavobacterium psychrophilum]